MAVPERVKNTMKKHGLKGVNKPKRTPSHKTKSHVVMAKEGKARKKSYYARHNAQGKPKSKLSAKYWSHKVKW